MTDADAMSDDERLFESWTPLPPGSQVWSVSLDAPVADVTAMRLRQIGAPLEVATRLGAVVRLGPEIELRLGEWVSRPG
jgi:hypothetical protein